MIENMKSSTDDDDIDSMYEDNEVKQRVMNSNIPNG